MQLILHFAHFSNFLLILLQVLRKGKPAENLIVSPLSVQIALAFVYAGADGKTKNELAKLLHIDPSNDAVSLKAYKELIGSLQVICRDSHIARTLIDLNSMRLDYQSIVRFG